MSDLFEFTLVAFTSILFVVDPLGTAPAFVALTLEDAPERRRQIAGRAASVATAILLLFALSGTFLLDAFQVSLAALRISGGAILFLVALDMIHARRSTQQSPSDMAEAMHRDDVAITPIAIPMLAGPAALATCVVLMTDAQFLVERLIVLAAIVLTGCITYVILRLAVKLLHLLGRTGVHVLSRLLGLLLLTIAVQFMLDGLAEAGFLGSQAP